MINIDSSAQPVVKVQVCNIVYHVVINRTNESSLKIYKFSKKKKKKKKNNGDTS